MNGVLDTTKVIDVVSEGGIVPVTVRNLTLKEKDEIYSQITELLKQRKRAEALELAKLLPNTERNKFLVEFSQSIRVTDEEVVQESQTAAQVAGILDRVCTPKLKWLELINTDAINQVLRCYYWALNIDLPDVMPEPEAEAKPDPSAEATQPDFFQKP